MGRIKNKFMRRALVLAETRAKYVSPNPRVGAVLVKAGRVVGEGATKPYGGPHAEAVALQMAGPKARGSDLYVTLEPCGHQGKTPPCADAVIRAGVRRVIAAMEDPNPLVRGGGLLKLREAGVKVVTGLMEREARRINESFIRGVNRNRPWVVLKAALSADGKIAPPAGGPRWITGRPARRRAHELRSGADAILVGRNTALQDNPSLTVRLPGYERKDGWPLRILLDSGLSLDLKSKLFQGAARTVVFTSPRSSRKRTKALERKGILVFRVPLVKKMLSLRAVLKKLRSLQVRTLLVEGGGEVHRSFMEARLVDEVDLFLSPGRLGAGALAWTAGGGLGNILVSGCLNRVKLEPLGMDFLLTARWKG